MPWVQRVVLRLLTPSPHARRFVAAARDGATQDDALLVTARKFLSEYKVPSFARHSEGDDEPEDPVPGNDVLEQQQSLSAWGARLRSILEATATGPLSRRHAVAAHVAAVTEDIEQREKQRMTTRLQQIKPGPFAHKLREAKREVVVKTRTGRRLRLSSKRRRRIIQTARRQANNVRRLGRQVRVMWRV